MRFPRTRFWLLFLAISPALHAVSPPVLFYSDLDSGPAVGGEGGTDGAFLCVYGENFGKTPQISVGGIAVATYKVRLDPGAPYLPGHFAKACGQLSHRTPAGAQTVVVSTSGGKSNPLPFTVRSGHVYFASERGSDRNPGSSDLPFATLKACKNALAPGDICYVHAMKVTTPDKFGAVLWLGAGGSLGKPLALVAYPGETVEIDGAPARVNGIVNYGATGNHFVGYFTIAGFSVNGFSTAFNGKPGSYIRFVDNDVLCTGANCSNLAAGFVASGSAAQFLDHPAILGNRFHDIGCSDPNRGATYFQYSSAPHPCLWISASSITIASSKNAVTMTGVPVGWSIPDVIRVINPANGEEQLRRPAASSSVPCIEGKAGLFLNCSTKKGATYTLILDRPFSPDLPAGTAWEFRFYSPAKTEHNVYFGAWTYHLNFGWNEINGNGLACRGLQVFHDAGPENNHDLYIHDNYIHDTVCDGINLNAFDATWGPVEIYNNLIVNAGRGISDIIADPVGGGANNAAIYLSGAGANPYVNRGEPCTGRECYPDQVLVFNNTIVNCGVTGTLATMQWPRAVGCVVRSYDFHDPFVELVLSNNLFVQPAESRSPYFAAYQLSTAHTSSHGNLCFGAGPCPTLLSDSVYGDPKFVGAARGDFHVSQSSAAWNASTATPVSTSDLDGQVRHSEPYTIGAYQ